MTPSDLTDPTTAASTVTVAPMRRRHLPAVIAIETRVHPRPWSEALFVSEISQPDTRCYVVARVEGRVVGHAGVLHIAQEGHVTTVAVDPAWQRRGIATRLMAVQIRNAIERGTQALTLEVRASNVAAQGLYRAFGFAPVGIRPGYYPAVGDVPAEDAVIMWAHDIDAPVMIDRLVDVESRLPGATKVEGVDGVA